MDDGRCGICGTPFARRDRGRPPKWCSDACRAKAARRRRAELAMQQPRPVPVEVLQRLADLPPADAVREDWRAFRGLAAIAMRKRTVAGYEAALAHLAQGVLPALIEGYVGVMHQLDGLGVLGRLRPAPEISLNLRPEVRARLEASREDGTS